MIRHLTACFISPSMCILNFRYHLSQTVSSSLLLTLVKIQVSLLLTYIQQKLNQITSNLHRTKIFWRGGNIYTYSQIARYNDTDIQLRFVHIWKYDYRRLLTCTNAVQQHGLIVALTFSCTQFFILQQHFEIPQFT